MRLNEKDLVKILGESYSTSRKLLGRLCGYNFFVCGMGWLPPLLWFCNRAPSSSIKKQMLAFRMGATKLVGSSLKFDNKQNKNAKHNPIVHMSYIVQTQHCHLTTNWAQKKIALLNALLKRSKLCNFCMTQSYSASTNTRLKVFLHGLFVCLAYSLTTHHTSHALRNPYTCQKCWHMENLPR